MEDLKKQIIEFQKEYKKGSDAYNVLRKIEVLIEINQTKKL